MTGPTITIAGRAIGAEHPPFVIAEMSANHNGDLDRAFEIMAAAKDAGAHALKIQTYTADGITIDHDGPGFRISEFGPRGASSRRPGSSSFSIGS